MQTNAILLQPQFESHPASSRINWKPSRCPAASWFGLLLKLDSLDGFLAGKAENVKLRQVVPNVFYFMILFDQIVDPIIVKFIPLYV